MKKLFLLTAAIIMMACSASVAQSGYIVKGTVEGTEDGDSVFLCSMQGYFQMVPEDTVVIKNHEFRFTGNVDGAAVRFIVPNHKGEWLQQAMVILEDTTINVEIYADTTKLAKVVGGETSRLFDQFQQESNKIYEGVDSLTPEIEQRTHMYTYDFVMNHIPSPISDLLMGYTQWTDEELKAIMDKMAANPPQYAGYKYMKKEMDATKATAIGQKYTDIALKSPEGKMVKVSDYVSKNKYTLIDFWASWCGPCRREMPNVVKAYTLYHKKGLEVVGVSLDTDKEAWTKALKQLQMPWPQMSDLKGWDSEGAAAYNIKAIPANVLVDQQGNIVAKDLREEELQTKLAELFPSR